MSEWIETKKRKPRVPRKRRSVPVLIWPKLLEGDGYSEMPIAYYGKRFKEDRRCVFRAFGREVFPTHWMPLPNGPTDSASGGRST